MRLRLAEGVNVMPKHGTTIDVDCRLLFIGDRYRQLIRAYEEAMFRLARPKPLAERAAFLKASDDVRQFYEITESDDRVALTMRDAIFREQAPLDELDVSILASRNKTEVVVPIELGQLKAVGALVPLLNGDQSEPAIEAALDAQLTGPPRAWTAGLMSKWRAAGFLETTDARPNPLLEAKDRPRVTFMGHTSIMIQSETTTVLTDPLYRVPLGVPPQAFDTTRLKLDAICCSHSHWDHLDLATLLRFDKRTPIVISRVRRPTAFNPPMKPALECLGFSDIREIDVWETIRIGDIEMAAVPFHGEQDEPGVEIDHYTYVFRAGGLCLYGGVDSYRDTFGEMVPALERVRREWAPNLAFLPISKMTYAWKFGGVNGFCRHVDTTLLDQEFQYTAGTEQAVEWARLLGVKRLVPYATFNFTPFDVPPESQELDAALRAAGLHDMLLPLRPFDSAGLADLTDASQPAMKRQYLLTVLRAGVAAKRIDRRLSSNIGYKLVKRALRGSVRSTAHHH